LLTVALALVSSVAYGFTDFLGGMATRKSHVFTVGMLSQAFGVVFLLPLVAVVGGQPSREALAWGALSGVSGAVAYFLLFRSLATGP